MTKAQKENIARFKKVQAEAKKLKAKNPRLAHTEAVKKAWAIVLPKSTKKKVGAVKKKSPIKKAVKSTAKKQTGKTSLAIDRKIQAKKPGKRVSKSGNVYYESRANRSDKGRLLGVNKHQDTKSHNVNIRVVSGIDNRAYKVRDELEKTLQWYVVYFNKLKDQKKAKIKLSDTDKRMLLKSPAIIKHLKKQIREQNSLINKMLK